MRQELASGMARPVATGNWTSVVRNANTTITITITQSIHTESEHETSGNRWLLVSVFVFALGSGWGLREGPRREGWGRPFSVCQRILARAMRSARYPRSCVQRANATKAQIGIAITCNTTRRVCNRLRAPPSINPILPFSLIPIESTAVGRVRSPIFLPPAAIILLSAKITFSQGGFSARRIFPRKRIRENESRDPE